MSRQQIDWVKWASIATIAGITGSFLLWLGIQVADYKPLPDKVTKLSDVVWQDHLVIVQIQDYLNLKNLETPRERGELSNLIGTNAVALAESQTNQANP